MDNTLPADLSPGAKLKEIFAGLYHKTLQGCDTLDFEMAMDAAAKAAKKDGLVTGTKQFKDLYHKYRREQTQIYTPSQNLYDFDGLTLDIGTWQIDDSGSIRRNINGEEQLACPHQICLCERLIDISTDLQKVKIKFYRDGGWHYLTVDKSEIASAKKIIALSDNGIMVTDGNAKYLIAYLQDVERLNELPVKYYTDKAGWLSDKLFLPYAKQVQTGEGSILTHIHTSGDFNKWLDVVVEARRTSIVNKIVLAASYASVLVEPFNLNNFFVHLWGTSGAGKTVALMLASSVWGNPALSKYTVSFYSTGVGMERNASALKNLPLVLDEFQYIRCNKKSFDAEIYMLANGVAKMRGNRSGGLDRVDSWRNIIITSGECPIVEDHSTGGIYNRILEIEPQNKLFYNGNATVATLLENYGFGGMGWIDYLLRDGNMEHIKARFKALQADLSKNDTTEKQTANIALLIAADKALVDFYGFDDAPLTVDDLLPFLPTRQDADATERAYQFCLQFIAANKIKFCGESDIGEVWGRIDDGYAYILGNVFDKALQDAGFSPRAALKMMIDKGLAVSDKQGKSKVPQRINGTLARCACIKIMQQSTNPPF
jgi:hypothetical protein